MWAAADTAWGGCGLHGGHLYAFTFTDFTAWPHMGLAPGNGILSA